MDLPSDPGVLHLAEQKARRARFLLGASALGHDCFNAYLKPFKKRENATFCYCDSPVDNAEHAFFVCDKWGVARETTGQAVGAELTHYTIVSLMLQSERIWTPIKSFVKLVMKTRELDGVGSETTGKASRNRIGACTLDRKSRAVWAAASVRGGILFLRWLARLVV